MAKVRGDHHVRLRRKLADPLVKVLLQAAGERLVVEDAYLEQLAHVGGIHETALDRGRPAVALERVQPNIRQQAAPDQRLVVVCGGARGGGDVRLAPETRAGERRPRTNARQTR